MNGIVLNQPVFNLPVGTIITNEAIVGLIKGSEYASLVSSVVMPANYGVYPTTVESVLDTATGMTVLFFDDKPVYTYKAPTEE